jgi:glycopeptide antibiotics resistance protein
VKELTRVWRFDLCSPHRRPFLFCCAWAVSITAPLVLTLGPSDTLYPSPWNCLFCDPNALADAIRNTLLFTPLGIALGLTGPSFVRALLIGGLFSLLIESAQYFIPGRDANLSDIITNVAGCGVGYLLVASAHLWLTPSETFSRKLSAAAGLTSLIVFFFTGLALDPTFPTGLYRLQWAAEIDEAEPYPGKIELMMFGDHPMDSVASLDAETFQAEWLSGSRIRIQAVAQRLYPGTNSLLGVYQNPEQSILLIGLHGGNALLRYHMRAATWKLFQPVVRLHGVTGQRQEESLDVTVWRDGDGYCVETDAGDRCGLGFTAGSGWRLFGGDTQFGVSMALLLDHLWVLLLLAPVGFWAQSIRGFVAGGLAAALGLWAVPLLTELLTTPLTVWGGAGLGVATGALLRVSSKRWKGHHS